VPKWEVLSRHLPQATSGHIASRLQLKPVNSRMLVISYTAWAGMLGPDDNVFILSHFSFSSLPFPYYQFSVSFIHLHPISYFPSTFHSLLSSLSLVRHQHLFLSYNLYRSFSCSVPFPFCFYSSSSLQALNSFTANTRCMGQGSWITKRRFPNLRFPAWAGIFLLGDNFYFEVLR
jgi:hypothetical protein